MVSEGKSRKAIKPKPFLFIDHFLSKRRWRSFPKRRELTSHLQGSGEIL